MEINGELVNEEVRYADLGLSQALMQAIQKKGYVQATPVQGGAIPYFMEYRDVIAKAPTGTGKTFAFGIPMVEHIDPESTDVLGLVLAPTRELAIQIRDELRQAGFLRSQGKGKKELKRQARPREFRTSSGFRVLVGRNNRQNDKLTLKDADHRDIWLHTQKIHGSHVILCTGGAEVEEETILEAAKLAAFYSQARDSSKVPVDYTPVKYVKKPNGARPGMVTYTTYETAWVTPREELVKELRIR